MTPTISGSLAARAQAAPDTPPAAPTATGGTDYKNMFLQLLVAQLQNQDPLSPSDGTQFVGQLAQFQQVESSLNMQQDLTAIRQDLDKLAGTTTQSHQSQQS